MGGGMPREKALELARVLKRSEQAGSLILHLDAAWPALRRRRRRVGTPQRLAENVAEVKSCGKKWWS